MGLGGRACRTRAAASGDEMMGHGADFVATLSLFPIP